MFIFNKIKKYKKIINNIFVKETVGPTTIEIGNIENKRKKFYYH